MSDGELAELVSDGLDSLNEEARRAFQSELHKRGLTLASGVPAGAESTILACCHWYGSRQFSHRTCLQGRGASGNCVRLLGQCTQVPKQNDQRFCAHGCSEPHGTTV